VDDPHWPDRLDELRKIARVIRAFVAVALLAAGVLVAWLVADIT
jgi:hypothetical protein